MIKGLRGATIWSEDLNNLLPFYRDLLGLPVAIQIPGFAVLGEPGTPTLALGTHSEVRGRNADPHGTWWASRPTTSTPIGSD
jgi:catechol-2,3-dioxygenase